MNATKKRFNPLDIMNKYSLILEMIIVAIVFQWLTKGLFLSVRNLSNILLQGSTCAVMAITYCLVIITRNSDLSGGRLLGMLGMIIAVLQVDQGMNTGVILLIVFGLSVLLGIWHGYWIGYRKLPAFIVTLATQLIFTGVTLLISKGRSIGPVRGIVDTLGNKYIPHISVNYNDTSLIIGIAAAVVYVAMVVFGEINSIRKGYTTAKWGSVIGKMLLTLVAIALITLIVYQHNGFSYSMLVLFALMLLLSYIIKNAKFGRYIYAIGGNPEAARLSGINVPFEILKLYILNAVVVACAAIIYVGRVGQAAPNAGTGYEFTAITGCVVGGTSISGGRGNIIGAVLGTMIMAALDNGMSLLNMSAAGQYIIRGCVLLLAIAMDSFANNRNAKMI